MELIAPSRQINVNLNATSINKGSKHVNSPQKSPPSIYLKEEQSSLYYDQEEMMFEASPEISALTHAVTFHLEEALRSAKTSYLGAGEVLFPTKLLPSIARDILRMAESEPLGLRGCLIHLNFESATTTSSTHQQDLTATLNRSLSASSLSSTSSEESSSSLSSKGSNTNSNKAPTRSIGTIKWDARSVPTFELSLTFKQEWTPWYNRLPHLLRLSKKPTVILSGDYTLSKKKLYRSGRQ